MKATISHRIILAVINDLAGDQRLHRIASSLHEAGHQVTLVGRLLPDSRPLANRPYRTHRFRLPVHKGKLFYLLFNVRLFVWLMGQRAEVITANDLDTLLACWLASRLRGFKLVYDSHELFTEVPELIHRPATRRVWLWLEEWLVPKLRTAYTVNESLAGIFSAKYGVPFRVIRNVPFERPEPSRRPPGRVLMYQGALNVGRGIELMIEAMAHLPEYELRIVGKGDVEHALRARAEGMGNVHFEGFVPLEQLHQLTCEASLGLSLEEDAGANYHFASPNKVYDYLQARIPALVSDLPEMRRLVETTQCGEVLSNEEREPEKLAARIRAIMEQAGRWQACQEAARKAAPAYVWEREQIGLLAIYEEIFMKTC